MPDETNDVWELLATSPFADLVGPIHVRQTADIAAAEFRTAEFRTVVGPTAANTMGRMHGGYSSALVDICTGQGVKRILADGRSLVTVSTNIDFLGSAALGDTLDIVVTADKVSRSVIFASCVIAVGNDAVVRAAVVFSSRERPADSRP